jgi:PPOX class probable F420-dependent enzyme
MTMLTRSVAERNRFRTRFFWELRRVDTDMRQANPILGDAVRRILDGPHLSVLATTNRDGLPQMSVIFVLREGDDILFSTIKGRRKTNNILREPKVNLLVHTLPVGGAGSTYATVTGTVEITDDPDGSLGKRMYAIYMGGATPPPEPGVERVIVRIKPSQVYQSPWVGS